MNVAVPHPDDFVFEGSKESVRKQIGMAVPAQGAKIIFEAILKTFAGIPYESVEASIKEWKNGRAELLVGYKTKKKAEQYDFKIVRLEDEKKRRTSSIFRVRRKYNDFLDRYQDKFENRLEYADMNEISVRR